MKKIVLFTPLYFLILSLVGCVTVDRQPSSDQKNENIFGYYQFGKTVSRQSWEYAKDSQGNCVKNTSPDHSSEVVANKYCMGLSVAAEVKKIVGTCSEKSTAFKDISTNTVARLKLRNDCACIREETSGIVNTYINSFYDYSDECVTLLFPVDQQEAVKSIYNAHQ